MNKLQYLQFLGKLGNQGGKKPAWTPAQLSGLSLWLDADDASTITLNGSTVSQWDDKSGNLNHVFQATSSKQPTLLTGEVDFDGADDMLTAASPILTGSFADQLTLFSVSRLQSDSGYLYGAVDSDGTALYQDTAQIGLANTLTGANVNHVTHGITYGSRGLIGAVYNNQSLIYSLNGTTITAAYAYTFAAPSTAFTIANRLNGTASVTYWRGAHSEIIALNRAITTAERQKLEGYLAHKWGLTASLPVNHPYKNLAPTL
jgi:hypothetical protein